VISELCRGLFISRVTSHKPLATFSSFLVDQGSTGIQKVFRHLQIVSFPGMICGLLEDFLDSLPANLEIAVQACLVETQDHHVIRSPSGEFSVRHCLPADSIDILFCKGPAT